MWHESCCKFTAEESNGEGIFKIGQHSAFLKVMNEYRVARFYSSRCTFIL